ncbi:MAG: hypothetical protein HOP16_01515 [Acidobacteria bacterium]|nr:hypothetical protein [Acidobacteriota bacterium]
MRKLLVAVVIIPFTWLVLPLPAQAPAQVEGVGSGARVSPDRVGKLGTDWTPVASADVAAGPTPRLHDGKPDLSGPWVGGGSNGNIERDGGLKSGELPLLPWAKALMERRQQDGRNEIDEPYLYCTPMGVPRKNPYPWRIVQSYTAKGPTHIFILHENGDGGGRRQIFMDGRSHPNDPIPTWFGHSIGLWDGDRLVVDTVGYNDKFWFDSSGTPHTEQLHTIERFTRPNYGTLNISMTLADPGAFSRPVELKFSARALPPDQELMEFICAENNQFGLAGGHDNIYREKGFGLEVPVPK